jgi:hypothetical protein
VRALTRFAIAVCARRALLDQWRFGSNERIATLPEKTIFNSKHQIPDQKHHSVTNDRQSRDHTVAPVSRSIASVFRGRYQEPDSLLYIESIIQKYMLTIYS